MEMKAWTDEDNISACDAEGREEDQTELMKAVPEWMPNDTRRNQLLQHFHDYVWHS